jgi:exopolysaccharide biosynthesis polyprenyl glycosylphosphotransferase
VVDATLRARSDRRGLARVSSRAQFGIANGLADVAALLGAFLVADSIRIAVSSASAASSPWILLDWSFALGLVVLLSTFYVLGLYDSEVYVSRPLHLWTLLKATTIALACAVPLVYLARIGLAGGSLTSLLMAFAIFVPFTCLLRFGVLDGVRSAWRRKRAPYSVLVGDSDTAELLARRLGQLRGFDQVVRVAPSALTADAKSGLTAVLADHRLADSQTASVFIDATEMAPRDVFRAAATAQASGAEVYLVSGLFEAAQGNRLLGKLFGTPSVRLRRSIQDAKAYPLKRAMDIVGSAILLLVSAPVIAVCGILIRLTSPGPVFYKQTRVGRAGVPFEFLKLRSMVPDGDVCIHEEYVRAFMNGTAEAVATGVGGEAIFKKVDDPRITPVGRFVRKYSLDELPQFWNVFRGDMSLVGPRPPLPYEVDEYDDWDSLRLSVPSGITGLWQVEGRSRVTFDEMILQDLVYAQNMRLLVDIELCLRTLPATLLGGGGG